MLPVKGQRKGSVCGRQHSVSVLNAEHCQVSLGSPSFGRVGRCRWALAGVGGGRGWAAVAVAAQNCHGCLQLYSLSLLSLSLLVVEVVVVSND